LHTVLPVGGPRGSGQLAAAEADMLERRPEFTRRERFRNRRVASLVVSGTTADNI
jgi:hypothetical protein